MKIKYSYNISFLKNYTKKLGLTLMPEFKFCPTRKFKADYCIIEWLLLLEIEGGVFTGNAHGSISGILRDIEKYNLAVIEGYVTGRIILQRYEIGKRTIRTALAGGWERAKRYSQSRAGRYRGCGQAERNRHRGHSV